MFYFTWKVRSYCLYKYRDIPKASTEFRCIALELNEGGGNGRVYPLLFLSWPSPSDFVLGRTSLGGTGGGDDIQNGFCRFWGCGSTRRLCEDPFNWKIGNGKASAEHQSSARGCQPLTTKFLYLEYLFLKLSRDWANLSTSVLLLWTPSQSIFEELV